MEALAEPVADKHCKLSLAYDPNHGGDGARIRLSIAGWINESCVKS